MLKSDFILKNNISEINSLFIEEGWITVYRNIDIENYDQMIFCCIIYNEVFDDYKRKPDWVIRFGDEGKPCISQKSVEGKWISEYHTLSNPGLEPFIYRKQFNFDGNIDSYVDISEEFVLYFKLYERGVSKQNRKFYFIDEFKELEEVIVISNNTVKVKYRYLREYLSIRKVNFAICFNHFLRSDKPLSEIGVTESNQDTLSENKCYNQLIRELDIDGKLESHSFLYGKVLLEYEETFEDGYLYDFKPNYEDFISGFDEKGNLKLESCEKSNSNAFTLTYFKKEVLDKYYNQPEKFDVDGFSITSDFFSLKIDNNIEDYVPVFLSDLSYLPHKEQIYWKHYNIEPQKPQMSQSYYKSMIKGEFPDHPEAIDLYFKYRYKNFNEKWENKFGWRLYKELSGQDSYRLKSLHLPSTNNVKTFCEQILSLSIVIIERLNEAELKNQITDNSFKGRGIEKFSKFLEENNCYYPDMIIYLRTLHDLRSGLLAHSFSDNNPKIKKALTYFKIRELDYRKAAKQIFIYVLNIFNTLESRFELNK